ncbi:hypothetical protein ACFFK0_00680 [Paenibacillus chartarius]|uniref:Uncharacterized protein n=1 Tax=Paenibacillus chartarius TaxID=747481 RepID=A0ABV6DEA6_9BACL
MFKRFDTKAVTSALEADFRFKSIMRRIKENGSLLCPYDGISICFDGPPSSYFLRIVMPAVRNDRHIIGKRRVYKYLLKHPLFIVRWEPLTMFGPAPYTSIKINPDRNNITPSQLLDLIKFIMGDYFTASVSMFDEKVDIEDYTPMSVAERLYVAHKRNIVDYKQKRQTYYIGSRKGMQVKVYDKAKLLKLKNKKLTRIERTVKYSRLFRPTITYFLLSPRTDMFDGVVMVDINKLDGRLKIMKLLKQKGIFMAAYKKLSPSERTALKRHHAFIHPRINLRKLASDDLEQWLRSSPNLPIKIAIETCYKHHLHQLLSMTPVSNGSKYKLQPQVYNGIRQWGESRAIRILRNSLHVSFPSPATNFYGLQSDVVDAMELIALIR